MILDHVLLAANLALGVGAAALVVAWARAHPGRRGALLALLALLGAWATVAMLGVGPRLPVDAFQPLREGFSLDHLRMASGAEEDVGRLPRAVWQGWECLGPPTLRTLVATNVLAAGWTVIGLGALALAVVPDRRLALLVTAGLALAPAWWTAAAGPLHAPIGGVYLLAAVGALLLREDAALPRWARRVAAAVALGIGAVLPGIRPELGALSVAIAVAVLGRPWSDAIEARIGALGPWTWRRTAGVVGLLGLWLLVAWAVPAKAPPASWGAAQWALGGLHPTSPHGLLLPLVLVGAAPVGLVLLALRGAAAALARPIRTGLLPLAVWAVFVTARVAAHGRPALVGVGSLSAWELYRYLLVLLPPVAVLAVLGARAVSTASPAIRLVVGLACLLPAVPSVTRLLDVDGGAGAAWPARFGIDRDPQVEIRAIARRLEAAPRCGVVALGHRWGGPPGPDRFGWAALVPRTREGRDAGFRYVRSDLSASTDAVTAAKALLGDVPCAVAWRSLDCAEVHGPGCAPLDALPTLEARAVEHRPFVHPRHGARWEPPVVVGWVAVPGYDPGPGWDVAAAR